MSTELKVLRKYYAKLLTLIQGEILAMSSAALAVHLLSTGEHSQCTHIVYTAEQKADCFMKSVSRKVEVNPKAFYTLLGVLKEELSFAYLIEEMEKYLKEMKNNKPDDIPIPEVYPKPPGGDPGDDDDIGIDLDLVDGTTVLNVDDDVSDVMDVVATLAANYYDLGQALKIRAGELKIIKNNHQGDMKTALQEVIIQWLKQNYNVPKFGEPTWRMLVKAVAQRSGGGDGALARKIAKKHQAVVGQASSSQ